MKLLKLVIVSALVLPGLALAMSGSDIDFHGYMRAGGGTNSKGGDMTCASNGTSGNEFRLGNECENYGEFVLKYNHKKAKGEDSFFYSQVRLVTKQDGHTSTERNVDDFGVGPSFWVREAFFEGGKFNGSPLTYWAGKRFYREDDVHMNDFYYFAETNAGFGGGVGNIPVKVGNLHLAYLKETDSTKTSDAGSHAISFFDARLKDVKITENDTLKFWAAYARNTKGTSTTAPVTKYDAISGQAYGVHYQHSLSSGFNHVAILYGKGLLDEFNVYGSKQLTENAAATEQEKKSNRIRLVEHLVFKPITKLDLAFSTSFEKRDNGSSSNTAKSVWYNYGVNPVYFFTENYSLAGVLGQSIVDADGSSKKTLTRFTIAPQVSIDAGYWARPVIRAFYTRTMWNTANRAGTGTTGINANGPYAQETALWNVGLQGEVFF